MSAVAITRAWPVELGEHLSASRLSMFQRCPEQFRRRYLLGEKERPGGALVLGSGVHRALEHNDRQKIESRIDLSVDEVQERFAAALDEKIDAEGGESEIVWGDTDRSRTQKKGLALVTAYHTHVSPTIQPIAVEKKITHTLPGLPVPIIGYVDVETADSIPERKVTGQIQRKPKEGWLLQAMVYRAALGKRVEWHTMTSSDKHQTTHVLTPTDHPALSWAYTPGIAAMNDRLLGRIAMRLHSFWLMFGPDEPWEGNVTHPWACGFCGYRKDCDWWQT